MDKWINARQPSWDVFRHVSVLCASVVVDVVVVVSGHFIHSPFDGMIYNANESFIRRR